MDQQKFAITGDVSIEGVPLTSLFTAAMRAKESAGPDDQRQFNDPFAAKLAQPALAAWAQVASSQDENKARLAQFQRFYKYVIDRTVYFDKAIENYLAQNSNCKQIVILGSGMDARAYRMNLPTDLTVFEIDHVVIQDYKTKVLKDDKPKCQHVLIRADMVKDDWSSLLTSTHEESSSTFDSTQPTLWIAEGLTMYIPKTSVPEYIALVNKLSAKDSAFIFDGVDDIDSYAKNIPGIPENFLISSANDTLEPLNSSDWQISNQVDYSDHGEKFYTVSKQ